MLTMGAIVARRPRADCSLERRSVFSNVQQRSALSSVLIIAAIVFTLVVHFSLSIIIKKGWWYVSVVPVSVSVASLVWRRLIIKTSVNPASPQPLTWQLIAFSRLPSRMLSRSWGKLVEKEVPQWLRRPLFGFYVWNYNCNMAEAKESDVSNYASLSQLFVRTLKESTRPVDTSSTLVAPVDGKVLYCGRVEGSHVEQVKGVHYCLEAFLGPGRLTNLGQTTAALTAKGEALRETVSDTQLYHVVMYLGPGDYHHFHSPADWTPQLCRHVPGKLLTVAPWAAQRMPGLFALNERVILSGVWPYGLFTFTAVGAYNVGSIEMSLEQVKNLQTNIKGWYQYGSYTDTPLGDEGVAIHRGDHVGLFRLGSSVVLLFEAPKNFKFLVKPGERIQYGQPLGQT